MSVTDTDQCVIWDLRRDDYGYAILKDGRRKVKLYRHVCEKKHGPPPAGKNHAAHSCGNGHLGCINQRHLRWATPKENADDRTLHGNSKNHPPKLSDGDRSSIFASFKEGASFRRLSREYGVTPKAISNAVKKMAALQP
jgi:hypothetical protein